MRIQIQVQIQDVKPDARSSRVGRVASFSAGFWLVMSALLLAAGSAPAQVSRIANGVPTRAWPEVGVLLVGAGRCTATFVGCRTAVTAAHCVCFEGETGAPCGDGWSLVDPSQLALFAPQGGIFPVRAISVPPDFTFTEQGDVAVLSLDVPLRRIRPRAINEQARLATGTGATIVGFGAVEQGDIESGLLRQGQVLTAPCMGGLDPAHVCWNFVPPLGPAGLDSNTCPGDSGGPLLADLGAGVVVAGVHSGGFGSTCHVEDAAFDTDVFVESPWLRAQAGVDLDAVACGDGAQVGDPAVVTIAFDGSVTTTIDRSFSVPAATKLLRIGLAGTDGGEVDLFVRAGAVATTTVFDCASTFSGSFEFCEIPDPAPGPWFVRLHSVFGATSDYQLTATLLPEDPPLPDAADPVLVSSFTGSELVRVDLANGARVVSSSSLRGVGAALSDPEGIARDADGSILVANPFDGNLLRVEPGTGDRVVVSGCATEECAVMVGSGLTFFGPRFVARASDGTILVADRSNPGVYAVVRVDPVTGARTTVSGCTDAACSAVRGAGPAIGRLFGIAVLATPEQRIFVADGLAVFAIDPETGDRTRLSGCLDEACTALVGAGPGSGEPADLVLAPDGSLLVSYRVEGSLFGSIRRVDPLTGQRETVSGCESPACTIVRGSGPRFGDPFGVAFDRAGRLLVADSRLDALLRVDLATGDRTLLSGCADPSCQSALGGGPRLAQPLDLVVVPEPDAGRPALAVLLAWAGIRARCRRGDTLFRRWTERRASS
ncbi:trypsin-like serine protease [Myxococcota bacterium]|nr:trypsin-like serine protease [Myxococcota bacterium]MCZ7618214.1 trypsin-like serine protease [Myxococcota bacterium]